MTLYRQLFSAISLLFITMFIGTWVTNIESTRSFFEDQLSAHAQDTATSLGLSLSPHVATHDSATMTAMVDAIFDRGYYRNIVVNTSDGTRLVERHLTLKAEGVPAWFIDWIPLQTPERTALIMAGWKQVASVTVRSHPGYAYAELWSTTMVMLSWFTILTALSIAATSLALRYLLKPLRAVEQQAEAICDRRYTLQQRLPRTRELRSVVAAMNRMTSKVQEMFESQAGTAERLREMAFADPLTGLGNRRYFDAQALAQLKSGSVSQGALFLIRLNGLQEFNESAGFEAGDRLLQKVAEILAERVANTEDCLAAKLSGADFALLAAHIDAAQAEEWAQNLVDRLAQLHVDNLAPTPDVLHLGVTLFHHGNPLSELLAQADSALRSAQSSGPNTWSRYKHDVGDQTEALGRQTWALQLNKALQSRHFELYTQQAIALNRPSEPLHREILVRLTTEDGVLHSANKFMPVAAQLSLTAEIDCVIIDNLVTHLNQQPTPSALFAINLSSATVRDPTMSNKILQIAGRCKTQIIFEISEFIAVRELEALREFASQAEALGHVIAIDHFGRAFSPFGYLQSLRPHYVKIDSTFTGGLEHDFDRQFYIRTLCSVAHSLDIQVIAANVEDAKLYPLLVSLNVDGAQGYATGEILPITY